MPTERLVRVPRLILIAMMLGARTAGTQQPALEGDASRILLATSLGGDSGQAAILALRAGATYRLVLSPAHAELTVRPRVRLGSTPPALAMVAEASPDHSTAWREFEVTAQVSGEHVLELTNPQVGATSVVVSVLRRAPADTLPDTMRRRLVFSETVGGGPAYVTLDSGKVYRFVVHDDVLLTPRQQFRASPVVVQFTRVGALGVPIMPVFTGEYRLDTVSPTASSSVLIYEEESDARMMRCLREGRGESCGRKRGGVAGAIAIALIVPAILLLDALTKVIH